MLCVWGITEPPGAISGPYDTIGECYLLCEGSTGTGTGTDEVLYYWCVDDSLEAPWWCVLRSGAPSGGGTCDCPEFPDGVAAGWGLEVSGIIPTSYSDLNGSWNIIWDDSQNFVAQDICVWASSPSLGGSNPRWVLVFKFGVWRLMGYSSSGGVVTFLLVGEFDPCGENTFTFDETTTNDWGASPTEITITPTTECDCDEVQGTSAEVVECVQSQEEPENTISGPYTTEAECAAVCGGVTGTGSHVNTGHRICVLSATAPVNAIGGPYTSETACQVYCEGVYTGTGSVPDTDTGTGTEITGTGTADGTITTTCCTTVPVRLYAHLSGGTGTCTSLNGTVVPIDYTGLPLTPVWEGSFSIGSTLSLSCVFGSWSISASSNAIIGSCSWVTTNSTSMDCNRPIQIFFDNVLASTCCTGTIDITILETA